MIRFRTFFFILLVSSAVGSCQKSIDQITLPVAAGIDSLPSTFVADDDHLLPGNPSEAKNEIVNISNYLMVKKYFALSYDRDRGIPNWVSWHLDSSDLGGADRQNDFRADSSLPSTWDFVTSSQYTNSGFDRGHNCPSADRTESVAANSSTFLMTNIMPQAPNNNQQTWGNLEDYERQLVAKGHELFIICGSFGKGGTGSKGYATAINNGKITVPEYIYKVLLILPNGSNDLKRISTNCKVIAVKTPNTNTLDFNWKTYRTTVDELEKLTGHNFLSNVSPAIQQILEARIDSL